MGATGFDGSNRRLEKHAVVCRHVKQAVIIVGNDYNYALAA